MISVTYLSSLLVDALGWVGNSGDIPVIRLPNTSPLEPVLLELRMYGASNCNSRILWPQDINTD
jgi:hypothetical protein